MQRPEDPSYRNACDAYNKLRRFSRLADTKDKPKEDGITPLLIVVFADEQKMQSRLDRFQIGKKAVFPTVPHLIDALDAAGYRCDLGRTNARGDTTWMPTRNPCTLVRV